jgi:DNA-binding NarL/FixJ family response regulator
MSDERRDVREKQGEGMGGFLERREQERRASTQRCEADQRRYERSLQKVQDPITVALIEDNLLVRAALTRFLNRSPDVRIIGGDPEGHESILRELDPDVVLLDLGLENGDSLRLATQVLNDFPDASVIVMDLLPSCEDLVDFVTAGVSGFVMKDATMDDVLGTIRAVSAGLKVLPDQMTCTLFSRIAEGTITNGETLEQDAVNMTPREREVSDLIAEGLSNKAIARELQISIHTVKSHLRNITDKLAVNSRLQIAMHVYQHGRQDQTPAPAAGR